MRVEKNRILPRIVLTLFNLLFIVLFIKGSLVVLFEDRPVHINGIQVEMER